MSAQTRKKVQRKLKIRGYGLKIDALEEILSFVDRFQDAEDEAIDLLLDQLEHESLSSSIIEKESVHRVISLLLEAEAATEEDGASCSSHSAIRKSMGNRKGKHRGSLPIHGEASAKAELYKDRFLLLFQRVCRDGHFSTSAFNAQTSEFGSCEICTIQSLIGQPGRRWVMGVISQLEDGHFYLEDLSASVEIDLSKAISFPYLRHYKITTGFFAENTIVLAEGQMLIDGIFQVITCGFPPLEDRDKSFKLLAGHDFFGGGDLTKEETLRLADLEKRAVNDMFVILSDIWLDNEEVITSSNNCFPTPPPLLFPILQFGKLGQMIAAHPRLKDHSRFLFIPGPEDAGPSTALPRCALPKYLTEELQKYIPNAIFSSNPCRIKFYTQEIVFFRQDLLYRMRRSCLISPSSEETEDPFEHLVATIIHQSHLCPLPLMVQPIIWNYDHSLHLYPTPHTIVLSDKSEQKEFKYTGITCFNPGSFSGDSTFVVYRPCTQKVELSTL
ncbi:hypothetical protein EZV62_014687 [Acer yangbiense]|uniref:DNA polymerase epsilon subunit n=1 Tax=Acer yangbiense TaxID=1000413 RepID=A0A5C7HTI7_9ROSI|nr:hypothetical protein EZV62_014687 [Acer yangbiense]